jgi:hypothetical protein
MTSLCPCLFPIFISTHPPTRQVHAYLRKVLTERLGRDTAESVRIIYGGSVNDGNCNELATQPGRSNFDRVWQPLRGQTDRSTN